MGKDNNEYRFGKRKESVDENVLSQERLEEIKRSIQDYETNEKVARETKVENLIHENYVLRCRFKELEKIAREMEKELYRIKYGTERNEECD